jgi:membrane fusion protein (multidrug efflux system)
MRLILIAFVTFFVVSCKSKKENPKAKENPPVTVDVLVAGVTSVTGSMEANGAVIANEIVEIRPEISGRLTYLNLPEGGNVAAGTLLAKINDADLQAQKAKTNVQLTLARKTEERLKKLLAVNGINQADYDAALNQVNNLEADLKITDAALEKTIIKAPFGGVLGLRMISPGAYVTPQNILTTLQQVDKVKVDFNLPESFASIVRRGSRVTVELADGKGKRNATVIATEPQVNATTRNLKVRATLDGGNINPGTFAKVTISTGGNTKSIVVPTSAIIPDARAKKVVLVKGGMGVYVDVETGQRMPGGVEITKGLNVGDSIVVSGVLYVRPGLPVKVRSVKKLEEVVQ